MACVPLLRWPSSVEVIMPDDDLLRLARQSAETDLPFLLRAKEEAKKRMKDNPTPENVGGFRRAREELEGELARRPIREGSLRGSLR